MEAGGHVLGMLAAAQVTAFRMALKVNDSLYACQPYPEGSEVFGPPSQSCQRWMTLGPYIKIYNILGCLSVVSRIVRGYT